MRRLLIICCLVVFIDVAFYEAITPLLADYRNNLGLTKGEAGILVGAYAAGSIIASLPAGLAAARLGPRPVIFWGLIIFAVSGTIFGFANGYWVLTVMRLIQGAAAAAMWSGSFAWLINAYPPERRGAVIGTALGVAVAGALFGPAIGALAGEIGTELVFSVVGALSLLLAVGIYLQPDTTIRTQHRIAQIWASLRERPVLYGALLVTAPSVMFGAVAVLVPLQIDALGGSRLLVAAGFAAGAGLEATLAPLVGRYSDRHGRMLPYTVGAVVCLVAVMLVPIPSIPMVLGALGAAALGAGMTFAPASAQLADSAEIAGLHQAIASATSNMAWALGQVVGAVAGGALAEAFGEIVPCVLIALFIAVVAASAWRRVATA